MERRLLQDLESWASRAHRKPLVVRGARQVGKTTLVRLFAERRFAGLVEINLERNPKLAELFAGNDSRATLRLLEVQLGQDVIPGRTLLFIDEIQAAPQVLAALRYFYEDLPELHVIAAGSLLEFALEQPSFPVPVGRIEYLHMGPMHFEEFLLAAGQPRLEEFLRGYELGEEIPGALHEQLLRWLRTFFVVGGMPESIAAFCASGSHRESEIVKHSILATFQDDFGKYGPRVDTARLRRVFARLPHLVGEKLKWVHVDREERARELAQALHLLTLARVAYPVRHSAANGIPLEAEAVDKTFKILYLDVGLMATATGLTIVDLEAADELVLVHRGVLSEQFVGQHLLYSTPPWEEPQLFYWTREQRNAAAEVDYVISEGRMVVPVEIKAGKSGTLKSLHFFLREKKRGLALRLSSAPPSVLDTSASLPEGEVPYRLVSLPLYLVGQVRRLVAGVR